MMNRNGLTLIVLALAVVSLGVKALPRSNPASGLDLNAAAALPVVDGGRVKPLDTVARTSLMIINGGKQSFSDGGSSQTAIRWLLDVMAGDIQSGPASQYKVFRIENDQLLQFLGLEARPGLYRYSLSEFKHKVPALVERADAASKRDEKDRDPSFDQHAIKLAQHLKLYTDLAGHAAPLVVTPTGTDDWQPLTEFDPQKIAVQQLKQRHPELVPNVQNLDAAQRNLLMEELKQLMAAAREKIPASGRAFSDLLLAYELYNTPGSDKSEAVRQFNQAISDYNAAVVGVPHVNLFGAQLEVFYNHFEPFYLCQILYVFVGLITLISWILRGIDEEWGHSAARAAFSLATLTLIVHTTFIGVRMYLHGRPPITNLYATAIFIGWAAVLVGLIIERLAPLGLGSLVAAVIGFGSMNIAYHLSTSGDTLEMMQAVLDTNFWLATHVVIINLGYAATFVAGVLGWCFVVGGVFSPAFDRERTKIVGHLIYGSVCFATLLSLVGTILGGIWADQSWGRFWGWDPKENGALVIVLWNALILHARWGGMVKERGLAVLALFGNVVTSASWFGTNLLGVGLHSYGFDPTTLIIILWITGPSALAMLLAATPAAWWSSPAAVGLAETAKESPPPAPTVRGPIAKALRQKAAAKSAT